MVTNNHYRWDFIGLSTDVKPTPATSEKVVDGSTFYCSDTSKLYVYCKDNWYERKPLGGGGGGSYTAGTGIDITNDTISVDTTVVQEKLTAGSNITITNNTISATGGGGTAIELSQDLYNWNSSTQTTTNPDSIALWLLDPGCYSLSDINIPAYTDYYNTIQQESLIWVFPAQELTGYIGIMVKNTNSNDIVYRVVDPSTGNPVTVALFSDMNMTLLSVKSNIIQTDSNAAPTSADYADRGQVWVYMDTNNVPHLYVSAGTDWSLPTPENTWIELQSGGGGGAIHVLTAADNNYDSGTGSPDSVALWLLPTGIYSGIDTSNVNIWVGVNPSDSELVDGWGLILISNAQQPNGSAFMTIMTPGENERVYEVAYNDGEIISGL